MKFVHLVKCRTDIPAIVFVEILKHAGPSSLLFRCASNKARRLVDEGYFRTCAPRIFVRSHDITCDRLSRVRRIVVGPDTGEAGIVVLSCRVLPSGVAKSPRSDEIACVRSYLDRFPADTVQLCVAGDYLDACVKGSGDFEALDALQERISVAEFHGCKLKKWHVRAITQILPPTLRTLSIKACVIEGPIGTLPEALAWFDRLSGLVIREATYEDPGPGRCHHCFRFEALAPALAKMRDLVDLDLYAVLSLGSSTTKLTDFIGAAQRLHTLRLGGCLCTVPVSLVRAIFLLPDLRELDLSRCRATFELLCEACGALERPAPALEVLDLHSNRFRPSGIGPVAEFIRAVPSLKEIFLQDTGVTHVDLATAIDTTHVLFHL